MRAPIPLQRIRRNEQLDMVTWASSPSGFFKGRIRRYSSRDFIAQVTLHVPPRGKHLVHRYGLLAASPGDDWLQGHALRFRWRDDLYWGETWFAALLALSSASTFWSVFVSRLYPNPKIRAEAVKKSIGKPMVSQMIAVITFAGCVWLVATYPAQPRT